MRSSLSMTVCQLNTPSVDLDIFTLVTCCVWPHLFLIYAPMTMYSVGNDIPSSYHVRSYKREQQGLEFGGANYTGARFPMA